MKNIKFSQNVYEKDFNVKSVGYDCHEVDSFFDEINLEIIKLEREIDNLKELNKSLEAIKSVLEQKNKDLQIEITTLKASNTVSSSSNANFSNIQLINRISTIESNVKRILDKLENQ